jgi:hypothetical protein
MQIHAPAFVIVCLVSAPTMSAAVSIDNTVDSLSVPGIIQNNWAVNTDIDFTAAAVFVELNAGTLHNPNSSGSNFETFEDGPGDTFVGDNDSPSRSSIQGGAGDLGHPQLGGSEFGPTTLGVTWSSPGSDKNDIGTGLPIGRFSFTDDAQGTWSMAVTVAFSPTVTYLSNPLVNGEMIFDPLQGDLNFDGFVGVDDLNSVLVQWNQRVTPNDLAAGDPSGDGFVGVDDLNTVLVNWNAGLVPLQPGTQIGLPSDMDQDGFVGINDLNIYMSNWHLTVPPGDPRADINGDGFVGVDDKINFNWNNGTPPSPVSGAGPPAVIPEPGTVVILCLGLFIIYSHRLTRQGDIA